MSFILRSSRYLCSLYKFNKNVDVFNKIRTVNSNWSTNFIRQRSSDSDVNTHMKEFSVEEAVKQVDKYVRQLGRTSVQDIERVLHRMQRDGNGTEEQVVLLLRCCGTLLPAEHPINRTLLAQKIWNTARELSLSFSILHYNALLRVYIENEHKFDPRKILSDIECNGLLPNYLTYVRIISYYCQQGDMDNAKLLLETMTKNNMPINKEIYNALITGYCRTGNFDEAKSMLTKMEQTDIVVDADTYENLLRCYAKNGDLDSITSTLHECTDKDVTLEDHHILNIIFDLSVNGHGQYIDHLIIHLKRTIGYHDDAVNTILSLISQDRVDDAYKLLNTLPRTQDHDGKPFEIGNFFIKQMVKSHKTSEEVINICEKMRNDKFNSRPLLTALEHSLVSGSIAMSIDILKELQLQSIDIRQQYFWPLLCLEAQKGDEYLINVVKLLLRDLQLQLSYETILNFIVPKLKTTDLIEDLCKTGLTIQEVVPAVVVNSMRNGSHENAYEIASQYMIHYDPDLFRNILIVLINRNSTYYYAKMVRLIIDSLKWRENDEDNKTHAQEVLASFINDLFLYVVQINKISLALKILLEEGLTITTEQKDKIRKTHYKRMSREVHHPLELLVANSLEAKINDEFVKVSVSDIQQVEKFIEQKEAKGENTEKLRSSLIASSLRANDLEKCEEIVEKLKSECFDIPAGTYVKIMDLCVEQNQIDKALEYYQNIRGRSTRNISKKKVVNLALGLVENGRLDEAEKVLTENAKKNSTEVTGRSHKILDHLAQNDSYDNVNRFLNILTDNHYILNMSKGILNPLVKVFLNKNDLLGATEKFIELANKYRCTAAQSELMVRLLNYNDLYNFQRVLKAMRHVHGSKNVDTNLIFIYVECGLYDDARKIIENHKFEYKATFSNKNCDLYLELGQSHVLEAMLDVTENSTEFDRNMIFEKLLDYYWKNDSLDGIMALWKRIEKESFKPSDEFLTKLGSYLRRKKMVVPFEIPKNANIEIDSDREESSSTKDKFEYFPKLSFNKTAATSEALKSEDISCVIEAWNKLDPTDVLNQTDFKLLLKKLATNGRFDVLMSVIRRITEEKVRLDFKTCNLVLEKAASAGYVEIFEEFSNFFTTTVKPGIFENIRCEAYVAANQSERYLDKIIENTRYVERVSNAAIGSNSAIKILSACPELVEKYKQMAQLLADKGCTKALNYLWMHYFLEGNEEAAKEIWSRYLTGKKLLFGCVLNTARTNQDARICARLIQFLKSIDSEKNLIGYVYGTLIEVHASRDDYDAIQQTIKSSKEDDCYENVAKYTLPKIKKQFEYRGKQFVP